MKNTSHPGKSFAPRAAPAGTYLSGKPPPEVLSRVYRVWRTAPILAGLLLLWECSSPLLKAGDVEAMNKEWSAGEYTIREEVRAPFNNLENDQEVVFQKGLRVRVWVESTDEWVRVKAYPAGERREQTRGRTIIYIFHEDLPEQDRVPEKVKELLRIKFNQLLVAA